MVLPANVCREVQAMPRACVVNEEDKLIWAVSPNGDFNLKSAYSLANGEGHQCFNGKWIWKTPVLPMIQFFLWMCCHNSLATREQLATRGIQVNTSCPICSQHPETIIHLLRDYYVASTCWQNLGMDDLGFDFYSSNLDAWLEKNCVGRSNLPITSKFLGTFSSPLVFGSCGIIATGWYLKTLPRAFPSIRRSFKEQLNLPSVQKLHLLRIQELKDSSDGRDQVEVGSN